MDMLQNRAARLDNLVDSENKVANSLKPADEESTQTDSESVEEGIKRLKRVIDDADAVAGNYSMTRKGKDLLNLQGLKVGEALSLGNLLGDPALEVYGENYSRAVSGFIDNLIVRPPLQPERNGEAALPPIIGFETDPDILALSSEARVKIWLTNRVPAAFLEGITSIRRVDIGELDDPESVDPEWGTVGTMNRVTGEMKIAMDSRLDVDLKKGDLNENKRKVLQEAMANSSLPTPELGTLAHEVGHNAHNNVLSYAELKEWDKIEADLPLDISEYVKKCRDKDTDLGRRENLAECFKLFLNDPEALIDISEDRFIYMFKLFLKYDTGKIAELMSPEAKDKGVEPSWMTKALIAADAKGVIGGKKKAAATKTV